MVAMRWNCGGVAVLVLWLTCAAGVAQRSTTGTPRPNILFLFADDLRPDGLGALGNDDVRTPHLDRVVGRGTRFAANYCMGSMHGAVCQPSRAMLMSGRTLWRVPMDLEGVPTLPEVLGAAGYATFATGKWHNGRASFARSFQSGAAIMFGGMSDHTAVPVVDMRGDGSFTEVRPGARFSSELFADAAIRFLAGLEGQTPFFAYVSFTAPHDPRQPPEPFLTAARERRPELPGNFLPQHPFDNGELVVRDEALAPWPRPEEVVREQLAEYHGLIDHMDAQVGRILAALEATGQADHTLVVFAADHGLAMGSHGLLGKQSLYEHSMRAPMALAGLDLPAGEVRTPTYLLDLFPTLCGLAGVELPAGVEGRDLRPVWEALADGRQEGVRDSIYTCYARSIRAVREGSLKLIRYPLIGHAQLFDLAADPLERINLVGDVAYEGARERLERLLVRWHDATDDPAPLQVDEPRPMAIDLSGRARKPDRWQPDWIVEKYFGGR